MLAQKLKDMQDFEELKQEDSDDPSEECVVDQEYRKSMARTKKSSKNQD